MSKVTIYSYGASKELLFAAVTEARTGTVYSAERAEVEDPLQPAAALTRIGGEFVRLIRDEAAVGCHRMLFGNATWQSEAGRVFYEMGPALLIGQLAHYLRRAHQAGSLRVSKPLVAADQFLALFLGGAHIRLLLGLQQPEPRSERELLRENVALFLARHQVPAAGAPDCRGALSSLW